MDGSATRQVADNVRALRALRRWSARQLAEKCISAGAPSLTRGTIAKIESGSRKSVTADELAVLAHVLEVSPSTLLARGVMTSSGDIAAARSSGGGKLDGDPADREMPRDVNERPDWTAETGADAEATARRYPVAAGQGHASPVAGAGEARRKTRAVNTLPADTATFTGRQEQVAEIAAAVAGAAQAGRVVAIHAIDGMPGVGKTTLAVHVGHLVADEFPDGQLFIDLHAHTPGQRPVEPADALASLLAAEEVDPRYVPADLEGRTAMWRASMAGKRVLLILDNAASSDQVAPLLPGAAGCLVLVTSRRYLGDLPGAPWSMPLDTLPPEDALAMFVTLAPRAEAEPGLVADIVDLCGYLPLAITLLAGLFARHRAWDMTYLIGQTKAKLLTVSTENRTVAAAFELSYQYLTAAQQRFFVHLGLHPGPDIDPYAAAALSGISYDDTIQILDELHADGLLAEPVPRRYRMNNLIHQYARSLAADFADEQ
jgi:transcriptional regulator with XRE-family HTH domain